MTYRVWMKDDDGRVVQVPASDTIQRYEITDKSRRDLESDTDSQIFDLPAVGSGNGRYEITKRDGQSKINTILAKHRGYDLILAEPLNIRGKGKIFKIRLSEQNLNYIAPLRDGEERHVGNICEFNKGRLGEILEEKLGYNPLEKGN